MTLSDPFGSAPDTARSLIETFSAHGVLLPEGTGPIVLDLGADARCSAGMELAKTDFERVVGGLRLILRALEEPHGIIAAGDCFREPFRLLRRLLGRGGNLSCLRYRPRTFETARSCLERKLGSVRIISAELCRAAFRAFYEEEIFSDRLVSVHFSGGCQHIRASFSATCRQILEQVPDFPTPARIIAGDLSTGTAVADVDAPLPDCVDALQLLTRHELPNPAPCIRCGTCMRVCPEGLKPFKVLQNRKIDLSACISCGKCTYFCPARLPLAERIAECKEEVTACASST